MKFCGIENRNNHAPLIRTSYFRFYQELNDFLPPGLYKKSFPYSFTGTPSVKNSAEAIGIPHTEIDLILVDGISVGFDHLLKGGEQVSVYPVFETFDISPVVKLRLKPLRKIRFVVDVNLGKLAKKLRLLGFDTVYRNDLKDDEIVQISLAEKRIVLTRDLGILKHSKLTHGTWIRNNEPQKQVKEVIERFQLRGLFNPFTRCPQCNGRLKRISRKLLTGRIPEDTLSYFKTFWECDNCSQIFWEGSHIEKITSWVEQLENNIRSSS